MRWRFKTGLPQPDRFIMLRQPYVIFTIAAIVLLCFMCLFIEPCCLHAEIFKYVDRTGVVYYSDLPKSDEYVKVRNGTSLSKNIRPTHSKSSTGSPTPVKASGGAPVNAPANFTNTASSAKSTNVAKAAKVTPVVITNSQSRQSQAVQEDTRTHSEADQGRSSQPAQAKNSIPENRQQQAAPQQAAPQQGAVTRNQPQPATSDTYGDSADIPRSMLQEVNLTGSFVDFKDYESIVYTLSAQHRLDPSLVKAVIKAESNWNQSAVSQKGAMGLMQLMPGTASLLSVNDPYDPVENIDGGIRYLKFLLKKFNGDTTLAIAAYNAGPGAVERYGTIPPYAETRQYVTRVLGIYNGNSYYPSVSGNVHALKTKSYVSYPAYKHIYKVKMHDGSILYTNTSPEAFLRTTERF